jgi:hypothetical protein
LVTDKPAPITVALAQKADSDNVSTLFDSNVTRGNLKNLVTDKPAPITVALLQLEKSDRRAPAHSMLIQTLPDDVTGDVNTHKTMADSNVSANGKTTTVPSNGDTIPKNGAIRIGTDTVETHGIEEATVHGNAVVGGTNVVFRQSSSKPLSLEQTERITGLYNEDPEPTFNWWDESNRRDNIRMVGDNKMTWTALTQRKEDPEPVPIAVAERLHGIEDGEDMGMGSITVMGTKVDLHQTKAERHALKQNRKNTNSWVTMNDAGDKDPELRRMRSDIKEGVLSYSNYMAKQFGNNEE